MDASLSPQPGVPSPDLAAYAVKLRVFEGPLDLLLHLIRLNEVDVHDIPVARIAEQYVEYLDWMRELDIDVASEYLVMAATLAWIKSRLLLPPEPGDEDGEEGVDPRAGLVARLLEYQRFREAAGELGERWRLGRDVFVVRAPGPEPPPDAEREIDVGVFELLVALRDALRTASAAGAAHELTHEPVSVRERMIAVMDLLAAGESVELRQVFVREGRPSPSRTLLVATFLALLELVRLAAVRVFQGVGPTGAPWGPIRLRRAGGTGDAAWREVARAPDEPAFAGGRAPEASDLDA